MCCLFLIVIVVFSVLGRCEVMVDVCGSIYSGLLFYILWWLLLVGLLWLVVKDNVVFIIGFIFGILWNCLVMKLLEW